MRLTDTIAVSALMAALEAAMEVSISSNRASYTINNTCGEVEILCNLDSMVGALMNLVNNAVQSAANGVELTITVAQVGTSQLQILIADNGPGIEKAVLENLQEPFFTTKPQGTGLGLSVVRAVAQAHHGDFELRSQPGIGTAALLSLPLLVASKEMLKTHENLML